MKLLHLEDNDLDADLTRRVLVKSMPDLEVAVARDVAGARSLLDSASGFDLALLDMRLPDGDGLEILSDIRARQLPMAVVMLTGSGDEQSVIRALKLQADDYLVKRDDYLDRLPSTLFHALDRFKRECGRRPRLLGVLYAEHNQDDAELTRMHFARHAPHIRLEVVSGAEGVLERLASDRASDHQVLLLDYRLVGMDALELLKTLRQDHSLDLPIVLVTGRGSEEAAAAALRLGVSDYLIKDAGYLDKLPSVLEHAYVHAELNCERARLHFLATYDELTGLLNRSEFRSRAESALSRAHRLGERCALLLVDLDDFKLVNDTFGHGAGDDLLRGFAGRLRHILREEDLCCRFGGDEFFILLEGVDQAGGAARTAERITEALVERLPAAGRDAVVKASIGIAIYPDNGADIDSLMMNADTAMYKAKTGGRSQYRFFDQAMNEEVAERFQIEADLHRALERGELFLVYQPQVELGSGRVVGVEALVRWMHPEQGVIAPDRFIPIAESGALIIPLGEWVLREACRQLKAWDDGGLPPLRMAVNLSARQIRSGTLDAIVQDAGRSTPRIRIAGECAQFHARRRFPAGFAVLGDDIGENAATHVELGSQTHEARVGGAHQIIEDAVGDVFVEVAFLAERPDVQLQALQFDATLIGDVVQIQRGEVGLAGFRAQTGELGDFHVDVVIAGRIRVVEGFQGFCLVGWAWRGASK
jgi:diguanylate cyclase (GGDEF)-like protein